MGYRIKEYRAKYDMKQEDLAKLVGVRRETIGNLEKGKYNPSLVWLGILQRFFMFQLKKFLRLRSRVSSLCNNYFPSAEHSVRGEETGMEK